MARWFWLVLALVVSTAGAGRLTTFAWDARTDWPQGTTVELCGNGDVCLSGITGTQATLDLPVSPGDVIQGRARAVAPLGYQCGTPPKPCPYSEWTIVVQTWPMQGIGGWAHYNRMENNSMATRVQYKGGGVIGADPATVTLDLAPTQNNLLVVICSERLGTSHTAFVMGGSGWTKRDGIDMDLSDLYERLSVGIFSKIAGASESATITCDNGTANSKFITAMEFSPGSGETFTFHGATNSQDFTPTANDSLSTGTLSTYSGNALIITWAVIKTEGNQILSTLSFSNATNAAIGPGGGETSGPVNLHGAAYIGSGTATSDTATWNITNNTSDPRSATAGIVAFTLGGISSSLVPSNPAFRFSHLLAR